MRVGKGSRGTDRRAPLRCRYSPNLMPIEMAFNSVLSFLRKHSNDPRYVMDYYSLLDDAFRSIDASKASAFVEHMYTELAAVLCPGPAL